MFGPNTIISDNLNISYSHRDKRFFDLYKEVQELFQTKFDLKNYDIIFIPGSATVGMEAVISSLNCKIVPVGKEGKFYRRWVELVNKYKNKKFTFEGELSVRLETSTSSVNRFKRPLILDAISSFPFYDLRKPKFFVTCSNKLLGGFPGLSIVGIRKDSHHLIKEDNTFSYLNLNTYLEYSKNNQLPTTAPTHLFESFKRTLINFDIIKLRERIYRNSDIIRKVIPKKFFIGDIICPVLTFKKEAISEQIAKKYELYGINSSSDYYQIFTYSDYDINYINFAKDVQETKQLDSQGNPPTILQR